MIARTHRLPVVRQCRLVELSRSTAYYRPQEESEENLAMMKRDRPALHGAPHERIAHAKEHARGREAIRIARSRVVRLMRLMGFGGLSTRSAERRLREKVTRFILICSEA